MRRGTSKLKSGIWRDLAVRKRSTEVTYQYEPILEIARRRGIAVPTLDAAVGMIASVERGERALSGGLADELLSIVQQTKRQRAVI
jgi:2-dehydropantoate 2-reductase